MIINQFRFFAMCFFYLLNILQWTELLVVWRWNEREATDLSWTIKIITSSLSSVDTSQQSQGHGHILNAGGNHACLRFKHVLDIYWIYIEYRLRSMRTYLQSSHVYLFSFKNLGFAKKREFLLIAAFWLVFDAVHCIDREREKRKAIKYNTAIQQIQVHSLLNENTKK